MTTTAAPPERDRKLEHIRLALEERMQLGRSYFDDYRFEHAALPEIDLASGDSAEQRLQRLLLPLQAAHRSGSGPGGAVLVVGHQLDDIDD